MELQILTPEGPVFSGEVESVKVPGTKGEFQILNNHAPIISTLDKGPLVYKAGGKSESLRVEGGVVEVLHNKVIVLAEKIGE